LTALLVVRVLLIAAPFAAALGATYWAFSPATTSISISPTAQAFWSRRHHRGRRRGLATVLLRKALDWLLVLRWSSSRVLPVRAFKESARAWKARMATLPLLAVWAVLAFVLRCS